MKITRKELHELIKEAISPGVEDDPVSLAVIKARASKGKNLAFPFLHEATFELLENNGLKNLSQGLSDSKRIRIYESYDMEKIASEDPYFKKTIETLDSQNPQNVSSSIPFSQDEEIQKALDKSYSKRTLTLKDYFKGKDSNDEFISEYVKNLSGVNPDTAIQSILNVMSCTDFNFEEDNDRWEIATLIMCDLFLSGTYSHTDATSRGVDVTGGGLKIEVKASQKSEPQDNYSNTIPPMDNEKYYVFIATNRCFFIRSDILRRYYLEPITEEQAEHFSGTAEKQYVTNFLMNPGALFNDLSLKGTPRNRNFDSFKDKAMKKPQISDLHVKIKKDIIDASDALAASIIQTIAGVPSDNRINAPTFGFGGLKIAMRLISRPEKTSGSLSIVDILKDMFASDASLTNNLNRQFLAITSAGEKSAKEDKDITVTNKDKKELSKMALETIQAMKDEEIESLYNDFMQDAKLESQVLSMTASQQLKNKIKAKFLQVLLKSGLSNKEAKAKLKNELPLFYDQKPAQPNDLGVLYTDEEQEIPSTPQPLFKYTLEEDQKVQERRRIYALGESHASLLRKKYYGRR